MISTKLRAILIRRWPILAISFAIGLVAGAASAQLAPSDIVQQYRAEQVIVSNPNAAVPGQVQQDSLKVTRGEIPVVAAAELGGKEEPDDLAADVEVEVDPNSLSITISSVNENADRAAARVNAISKAFLDVSNNRLQESERLKVEQLEDAAKAAEADLALFDERFPDVLTPTEPAIDPDTGEATPGLGSQTELISQRQALADRAAETRSEAKIQDAQIKQRQPYESLGEQAPRLANRSALEIPTSLPLRSALLGLLGLLLGAILALILERLNRRIDTRQELAASSPLPIIAEVGFVPERRRPIVDGALSLSGMWAEPYRRVRSAMQFVQEQHPPSGEAGPRRPADASAHGSDGEVRGSVFMFTSTAPQEGKSSSAILTAQAFAEVGVRTLLVGADYRRPTLESLMGAEKGATIADLTGPVDQRPTLDQVVRPTKFPNLFLAVAGQPTREVSDILAATRQLVERAASQQATVIIDTSPLNAASDPLDLLPVVDHVIMVVRSGRSAEADLVDSVETLTRLGGDVMGNLLVGTPGAGKRQAYYYDYYSGEGLQPAEDNPEETTESVADDDEAGDEAPSEEPDRDAGDDTAEDAKAESGRAGAASASDA